MKDNYLQELPKPKDKFCPLFSKGISVGNQIFIAEFNKKKKLNTNELPNSIHIFLTPENLNDVNTIYHKINSQELN